MWNIETLPVPYYTEPVLMLRQPPRCTVVLSVYYTVHVIQYTINLFIYSRKFFIYWFKNNFLEFLCVCCGQTKVEKTGVEIPFLFF